MPTRRAPRFVAAAALLVCLGGSAFAREDPAGYDTDYDYPGQGDDWYGRPARPDPRQDYARPLLDQILSGDDFCQGYERAFDPWRLGPPLPRTQGVASAFAFRFSVALGGWPCLTGYAPPSCDDGNPCTQDGFDLASAACVNPAQPDGTSCTNGTFCDGVETCSGGICGAGAPPSCDDGSGCTLDYCNPIWDQCINLPLPVPPEVEDLAAAMQGPGSDVMRIRWAEAPAADTYNVYRGTSGPAGEFDCYLSGVTGNEAEDLGEVPPPGAAWLYLVTGVGCSGETILGQDSAGQERINTRPCR